MHLIVFDIDGTLTRTSQLDDACYVQAVAEVFGLKGISTDWSLYEHCTDVAIAHQLIRERLKRVPQRDDIARLRARFVELVREGQARDPSTVTAVPGAPQILERLASSPGHAAAVATGGFEASARFKLKCAGLERFSDPAAFAEDGPSRRDIVSAAIGRAAQHFNGGTFERVVTVGDGLWDLRTAAELKLPFVGIAQGERAEQLRAAGAEVILADFTDPREAQKAFERAPAPRLGTG